MHLKWGRGTSDPSLPRGMGDPVKPLTQPHGGILGELTLKLTPGRVCVRLKDLRELSGCTKAIVTPCSGLPCCPGQLYSVLSVTLKSVPIRMIN